MPPPVQVKCIPEPGNLHKSDQPINKLVIKTGAGQFLGVAWFNTGPAQYLQLHMKADPQASDKPFMVWPIKAGERSSFDFTFKFTGGLTAVNSTTRDTYTAGAADCWLIGTEL